MPPLENDHREELRLLAGMNRGLYAFSLAPDDGPKSDRPAFFITVEEDGAAPAPAQPRGKVVLGSQRI